MQSKRESSASKRLNQVDVLIYCLGKKVRFKRCDHKGHTEAKVNFRGFVEVISLDPAGHCLTCRIKEVRNAKVCSRCSGPKLKAFGIRHDCSKYDPSRASTVDQNGSDDNLEPVSLDDTPTEKRPSEPKHVFAPVKNDEQTLTTREIRRAGRLLR